MAIKLGYYHIDAAEVYNTEREVGLAIEESKIEREKLYVTTKVITNIADIPKAIDTSLKKLKVDYVDLCVLIPSDACPALDIDLDSSYLIHSPFFAKSDSDFQNAWRAMEAVKASGKARSIGVSNYLQQHLEATLAIATTPPSINQIEFHPYLQHGSLIDFQKSHNIATAAYAPLTAATKGKPGPCDEMLAALSKKYYVSEGDVSLR